MFYDFFKETKTHICLQTVCFMNKVTLARKQFINSVKFFFSFYFRITNSSLIYIVCLFMYTQRKLVGHIVILKLHNITLNLINYLF